LLMGQHKKRNICNYYLLHFLAKPLILLVFY